MTSIIDLIIVGGGPAGLYAAFYGGLRDLSIALLEARGTLGGKINFYPEKFVWDIGALPATQGKKVRQNLIEQAETFGPEISLNTKVTHITQKNNLFYVTDNQNQTRVCRSILLAVGGGVVAPKKLSVPINEELSSNVHYAFPNHQAIKGKRLVISGGGDAALDYGNECLDYAKEVFVVYRGNSLKALEASHRNFLEKGGQLLLNQEIHGVRQGSSHEMEIVLSNQVLATDHLLIQHGYDRDSSLLDNLPFTFEKVDNFYLHCDIPTQTNIPGIFAAGDIQTSKGKLHLLAGAFQDAANSINLIKQYLDPESHQQAMVSSHNHKFDEKNHLLLNK